MKVGLDGGDLGQSDRTWRSRGGVKRYLKPHGWKYSMGVE